MDERRCQLHEIKAVAKMLKRHLQGLLNFVRLPIAKAVAEDNLKIQAIKADARGLRNFLTYRTRVLFFGDKLDLSLSITFFQKPIYMANSLYNILLILKTDTRLVPVP